MVSLKFLNIFSTVSSKKINKNLLTGKMVAEFNGQLIFKKKGKYFITHIDNENENYIDKDFATLPEGSWIQLINGKLIIEQPRTCLHQGILGNLGVLIYQHNKTHQLGKVFFGPLDTYLDKHNVFQPDLIFIAKTRKNIIQDFVFGAPNFVVEVTSPSSEKYDLKEKLVTYGRNNVLEYWVIHPKKQELLVYLNKDGKLLLEKMYSKKGKVKTTAIKGFSFQLADIFDD